MTKNLRTIKASIVMGILFLSIFAILMPSTSAGIIKSNGNLKLEYDAAALEEQVTPLGGPRPVTISIGYLVSGIFATQTVSILYGRVLPMIELSVEETPPYATAWVQPNVISPDMSTSWSTATATLWVSFKENVPARAEVTIRVKMHARAIPGVLFEVQEVISYADVSFTPGYLPIISVSPKGNFQEISPGEIATFDIEIENLGNAKTVVDFKILDIPEEWSPNIQSRVTLGAGVLGEDPKSTVQLVIQPPYGFGYHNDRETIRVEITPSYYGDPGDPEVTGMPQIETFTVQSRGFSTPGFEAAFVVFALMAVVIIFKKRHKAN